MGRFFEQARTAREQRLIACWISSSEGLMATLGTSSSTCTSKKGRSTCTMPAMGRDPTRRLSPSRDCWVQTSTARYICLA
eukprot:scaffold27201_cov62-Phaeocystis_antarctica.AAC.3